MSGICIVNIIKNRINMVKIDELGQDVKFALDISQGVKSNTNAVTRMTVFIIFILTPSLIFKQF